MRGDWSYFCLFVCLFLCYAVVVVIVTQFLLNGRIFLKISTFILHIRLDCSLCLLLTEFKAKCNNVEGESVLAHICSTSLLMPWLRPHIAWTGFQILLPRDLSVSLEKQNQQLSSMKLFSTLSDDCVFKLWVIFFPVPGKCSINGGWVEVIKNFWLNKFFCVQ